ncbi:MAG: helical backbone metal receptor [Thermoplasmatota archaeon]
MRVVSLVPSHTETLFDLGMGPHVVGRTRFCIHPEAAQAAAVVGGTKDAKAERILALTPDLVVADRDENPKALVETLQGHGIDVLWSDISDVADAAQFVVRLGRRVGADEKARQWADAIEKARAKAAGAGGGERVFCPIWHPWMTFDQTSYPSAMLAAVGLQNAFAAHQGPRYFPVDDHAVHLSGAAWTLLPTEPFPFHTYPVPTAGLGAAGRATRVRVIDGEALTWFGTRTAWGLETLAASARQLLATGGAPRA